MLERLAILGTVALLLASSAPADACDDAAPERYRSAKTIWCVNPGVWSGHQAEIETFFPYGDRVVDKLVELFAVSPSDLPYTVEAMEPNGYAMTPSHYGPGVAVTGDAFYNDFAGISGFWGYLLVLHEFVNQWTGLVTGGWPTDWWADHRSPFPNSMDEQILRSLGETGAADAQHARFADPSSGDYDAQVVMFNELFEAHGFEGLRRTFELVRADHLSWFDLRDPPAFTEQTTFVSGNPSVLLSNYVGAYLSLGAGEDVTARLLAAGVGARPENWQGDWQSTAPTSELVTAIANAHCAIAAADAAGSDVTAARTALIRGDHAGAQVAAVPDCAQHCPGECACDAAGACVAPWTVDPPPPGPVDAGGSAGDDDGGSSPGGCGCRTTGSPSAALLVLAALLALRRRRS